MTTVYVLGVYGLIWTGFSVSLWLLVYAWVQLARAIGRNYFRLYWFLRFGVKAARLPPSPWRNDSDRRGGLRSISPRLVFNRDDLSGKEGKQC